MKERKVRLERVRALWNEHDFVGDVVDHLVCEFLSVPGAIDLVNKAIKLETDEEILHGYRDLMEDVLADEDYPEGDTLKTYMAWQRANAYLWTLIGTEREEDQ